MDSRPSLRHLVSTLQYILAIFQEIDLIFNRQTIMIHIEESYPTPQMVTVLIEGKLDRLTLPTLQEVCQRHFDSDQKRAVTIEIRTLSISIEGKNFLREIQDRVCLKNLPEFLRMELAAGSNTPLPESVVRK